MDGLRSDSKRQEPVVTITATAIFTGSIAVGCGAILLAMLVGGGGHGSYGVASVFFPYTMLSTRFFYAITPLFGILALVQFPIYGACIGWALLGSRTKTALMISVSHTIAAIAAILWRGGSFYP